MKPNKQTPDTFSTGREEYLERQLHWSDENHKPNNQKNKKYKSVFLTVIILVLVSFSILTSITVVNQYKLINELTIENANLNKTTELLNGKYLDTYEKYEKLKTERLEAIHEFEFYKKYVVRIDNKDEYYHKYLCFYLDDEKSVIYDLNTAISEGYKACPKCCK